MSIDNSNTLLNFKSKHQISIWFVFQNIVENSLS